MTNPPERVTVVGAGSNGLTAAALLARRGVTVDVFESRSHVGGATASARPFSATSPESIVDLGAAGHPFGVASPAFKELGLTDDSHVTWSTTKVPLAHPLPGRPAALLRSDLASTAEALGRDAKNWRRLHAPIVEHIDAHLANILGPMVRIPPHPLAMARFAPRAAASADLMGRVLFHGVEARALLNGSAAHAICPPTRPATAAFGVVFSAMGMTRGWPVVKGGSGAIADALARIVINNGGAIHLNSPVTDLGPFAGHPVILDLGPEQILTLRGTHLSSLMRQRLRRWRRGSAVFKVDYLLNQNVPWQDPAVSEATTVHVVGSPDELRIAETEVAKGKIPTRPFVMVCQQQAADVTRSPDGVVLWTYAHIPRGAADTPESARTVLHRLEEQMERFAPGFRDTIVERRISTPTDLQNWDHNLIGGDIAGGAMDLRQLIFRLPHHLGKDLYLCSSSTAPGAGVHGMGGWWAVDKLLKAH